MAADTGLGEGAELVGRRSRSRCGRPVAASPAGADPAVERHIVTVAASWLDATLFGNAQARSRFVGSNCGLCSGTPWVIQSKNWG